MTKMRKRVLIFRSLDRANSYAEHLAEHGDGLNIKCTTSTNYIKDLLLTSGLGVQVVDEVTRVAFIISIVNNLPASFAKSYFTSESSIELLCQLVKNLGGVDYERVGDLGEIDDIKTSEKLTKIALIIADHYFSAISAIKLVEIGTLARSLHDREFKVNDDIQIIDNIELQPALYEYYKYLGARGQVIDDPSNVDYNDHFSAKQIEVDILTGSRARTEALQDVIAENKGKKILLSSDSPDEVYANLKTMLEGRDDVMVTVKSRINLFDTYFGQQILNAYEIYSEKGLSMTVLSNFAHNPYSCMRKFKICEYDKRLRGSTFSGGSDEIDQLMQVSETAYKFLSLFSDGGTNIDQVISDISNIANDDEKFSKPTQSIELSSLMVIRSLTKMLFSLGFQDVFNPNLIKWLAFSHEKSFGNSSANTKITIVSKSSLKKEAKASYDTVASLDISSSAYNAKTDTTSIDRLLEDLGICKLHTKIDEARCDFAAIGEVAQKKIIMFLPMRNESFEDVFTSFPAQELFSIDSDKLHEIKKTLEKQNIKVKVFGEENLSITCGHTLVDQEKCLSSPFTIWKNDLIHDKSFTKFLHFETIKGARLPILSPSQIESYITCPYLWFYDRMIGAKSLDYEFNALVCGNIVHEAYKCFYDELRQIGVRRLTSQDKNRYDKKYSNIFSEKFDGAMYNGVSDTTMPRINVFLESHQRENLYIESIKSLHLHSELPKNYYVEECEYDILEHGICEYAGAIINGRIDRVDCSDTDNSFYIIDYKAKIKNIKPAKFDFTEAGELICTTLPSNIQTLIYSSIYEKISNKYPVASLYAAYLHSSIKGMRFLNGAVDPKIASQFTKTSSISPDELANCDKVDNLYDVSIIEDNAIIPISLSEAMSAIEKFIAPYIERMVAGDISPLTATNQKCAFCNVDWCKTRS